MHVLKQGEEHLVACIISSIAYTVIVVRERYPGPYRPLRNEYGFATVDTAVERFHFLLLFCSSRNSESHRRHQYEYKKLFHHKLMSVRQIFIIKHGCQRPVTPPSCQEGQTGIQGHR